MTISNKEGAGPKPWDLPIDQGVCLIGNLASKWLLSKFYMADKTNLDGQKLMAAVNEFTEDGLRRRQNTMDKTLTMTTMFESFGMYFIAPMLPFHFVIMCRYRRGRGTNLWSLDFANEGGLQ